MRAFGILLQFLFEREKPSYLLVGKKGKQAKVGSFSLSSFLFSPRVFLINVQGQLLCEMDGRRSRPPSQKPEGRRRELLLRSRIFSLEWNSRPLSFSTAFSLYPSSGKIPFRAEGIYMGGNMQKFCVPKMEGDPTNRNLSSFAKNAEGVNPL